MSEVEKDANQLLREKYFVEADRVVLSGRHKRRPAKRLETGQVIDASRVVVSRRAIVPRPASETEKAAGIRVHVVKEGDRMTGIKIQCPCGRHADLSCEYEPEKK